MESLFAQPRRRRGACESLLARTMRAWTLNGHLVGDEHAAARGVLRDAARAVDRARADLADDGTAYSFARCNELYRQALADLSPGGEEVTSGDGIDALLAELSSGAVLDTPHP